MNEIEIEQRYAELILECGWGGRKNVEGRPVHVYHGIPAYSLLQAIAKEAYKVGKVSRVDYTTFSPALDALHVDNVAEKYLTDIPTTWSGRWNDLVKVKGATLRIEGTDAPLALARCDARRLSAFNTARIRSRDLFYSKGLHTNDTPWCIIPYATEDWGKMIFPSLASSAARRKLQGVLIEILGLNHHDVVKKWWKRGARIARRSELLDENKFECLHVMSEGTDLQVYLHPRARFGGGMHKGGAAKQPFFANIPTFENYTTPDARRTEGHVTFTRPVLINGQMVDGLKVEFRNGKVSRFTARTGAKTFAAMLATDEGATRLGEVALVGIDDSPIFQTGIIFHNVLLDENAACHIAFGRAYPDRLLGGLKMSAAQKAACGCNESLEHRDCMISNEKTRVIGVRRDGSRLTIIEDGAWAEEFK